MAHLLLSDNDVEVYFKLYILLYADDTVIFAENEHELQAALNAMFLFCKSWDLEVNPTETKITILVIRSLIMSHYLSTMTTILRLMIVLYTWVLYFHTTVVFLKIARDCMIKPARLCILCCISLRCYVFLLIFSYNFLIAWWLQFYYRDQKCLDSKSYVLERQFLSPILQKNIIKAKKQLQM